MRLETGSGHVYGDAAAACMGMTVIGKRILPGRVPGFRKTCWISLHCQGSRENAPQNRK